MIRIVSRQILNSENDRLAGMSWRDALSYSDVLDFGDCELTVEEIEALPRDLCLAHTEG